MNMPRSTASCSSGAAPRPTIPPSVLARARAWFDRASESDKATLLASIMAGLPGAFDRYDIPALRRMLDRYKDITRDVLRENLARFLREVIPTAEEVGIRMAIHPDDPPRELMGLPRIVSSGDDLAFITSAVASDANGITFCTGSLGAGSQNDVPAIARRFAERIHFVHLRNVAKEPDGSFMEADHLGGDTDMVCGRRSAAERAEAAARRRRFRLAHPVPAGSRARTAGRRRQEELPRLLRHRTPEGTGGDPRGHDRCRAIARAARVTDAAPAESELSLVRQNGVVVDIKTEALESASARQSGRFLKGRFHSRTGRRSISGHRGLDLDGKV